VNLYERIPFEVEEKAGDFALVSLRVRELFDSGKRWQDEITRNTMISARGGKRRTHSSGVVGSPGKAEQEQEASAKLQMQKMKQLADHPVLSKVRMSVCSIA